MYYQAWLVWQICLTWLCEDKDTDNALHSPHNRLHIYSLWDPLLALADTWWKGSAAFSVSSERQVELTKYQQMDLCPGLLLTVQHSSLCATDSHMYTTHVHYTCTLYIYTTHHLPVSCLAAPIALVHIVSHARLLADLTCWQLKQQQILYTHWKVLPHLQHYHPSRFRIISHKNYTNLGSTTTY